MLNERAHVEAFHKAIEAEPRSLRRDASGRWQIGGKRGQIVADGDGKGWLIEEMEGTHHFDRLPTAAEAELIRAAIGVKRRT